MNTVNIYGFADEASPFIDEQIIAMKRNGLKGLEIRNVDNINVSDISLEKAKEVKKKIDDAGLLVWSIGSPIGKIDLINDDFNKHLEKFKHTLEIADILGCKNIRLFSFFMPDGINPDEYKDDVLEKILKFTEINKNTGITLCHENEKGIYGDIARRCLDIHKAIPEIKAVFDPANFVQCGQNTIEAWEALKPYVHYLHIKDALSDGSIVPCGKGDGNAKVIINEYRKNGGTDFTMEPHLAVFSGLEALEQDGNISIIGNRFVYENNDEAFDAGCNAFKALCY